MKLRQQLAPVLACALMIGGFAVAQEATKEAPATRPAREPRIVLPYSLLEDMTDEQRSEIVEIRKEIAVKLRAIRAEEKERTMAVLTPEQRERLPGLYREYRRQWRRARGRPRGRSGRVTRRRPRLASILGR